MSSSHKMKTLTINGVQFTIVDETVGSLSDLNTTDKSSVVAAVNEVASNAGSGSGGGSVTIDATLTQEGQAADAKAVGDALAELEKKIPDTDAAVKSVNGQTPDENGNVEIPVSGGSVDLSGYATEQFVRDGFQPKGDYLLSAELPNAVNDALAQAKESGEFDGEKGEPGNSGVYIGSTKPVDPDVHVWINPDEEVDRYVKSVNGVTPDENGNVEITIPEGSVGTNVTLDPTLTQSGAAADAKAVGDAIANIEIPSIEGLATEEYVDEAIANIDIPSGGFDSNETWELLCDVTLEEEVNRYEFNFDNTPMKKLIVILDTLAADADTSHSPFTIVCNNDIGSTYKINQGVYPLAVPMKNAMRSVYEISAYYMADVPVLDVDTLTQKTISLGVIAHGKESTKYYVHFESLKENYANHIMVPEIVRFNQNTYGVFAAGTRYRIYGVKA